MATELEDLRVLKRSEDLADRVWNSMRRLRSFERRTLGEQLIRSADSIGANISECHGRYHFREKIRFLYYARGSLSETKYWVRRAHVRELVSEEDHAEIMNTLEVIAKEINRLVSSLRRQIS